MSGAPFHPIDENSHRRQQSSQQLQNPGMDKSNPKVESTEKAARSGWPRWKKIGVMAIIVAAVVTLAVGLGVGLTRRNSSNDDDDNDNSEGNDDVYHSPDIPEYPSVRDGRWNPRVGATWQIILKKPLALDDDEEVPSDVEVWDLDLFDNDFETFDALHDQGKKVICYFSAGSWEDWRGDKDSFKEEDLGKTLDGWEDEKWLKLSSPNVRNIMKKRIDLASRMGCDAVDPDNVDGYQNDNGLGLTEKDSIDFMKFLSEEAHGRNMSIGLKNAGDIIPDVLSFVDFSVNEQCVEYSECETFAQFIDDDKPVFHIEYPDGTPDVSRATVRDICSGSGDAAGAGNFSTVVKNMDLDGWVEYCNGNTFESNVES